MGTFLESWQSHTPLDRSELIPLMRSFTLAVFRAAIAEAGLSPEAIARLLRRGQIQGDEYGQRNYEPVEGFKVYFKQFKRNSDLYDRIIIALDPPSGGWCLVLKVSTEPAGTRRRIRHVATGLQKWGAPLTGVEERIHRRATELAAEAGFDPTASVTAQDEERRWGACVRLTEWSGEEEALVAHLGRLIATWLRILRECRTWSAQEPHRFVTARLNYTAGVANVVGQVPSGGGWQLTLGERDARQLAGHGTLIAAQVGPETVRLRLTHDRDTLCNFTSCEGAFSTIGDLAAAMGLRHDDRVRLVQEEGAFRLERAPLPAILVPGHILLNRNAEDRFELTFPGGMGTRIRQWQNGLARGEQPELYLTDGKRVTQRATVLALSEGESLTVATSGLEPYELELDALRVADTWEPLRDLKGIVAVYDRTVVPEALRPGAARPPKPSNQGDLPSILAAFAAEPSLVYAEADLINLHTALTALSHKHFVILHGPSGTGKSQLAQAYANALHGRPLRAPGNPYYKVIPVQPTWQDRGPLLGYFNSLTGRYEVPDFLAHLMQAVADPAHPYILCLDEMNLAVAEHYFADFLSAWESRELITLHRQGAALDLPEQVRIPPNFYVIGTVNIDETTHSFSPKVLDRAFSIELAGQDLWAVIDRLIDCHGPVAPALRPAGDLLKGLQAILEPEGLGFAYRTAEEVLAFLAQIAAAGWPLSQAEAIDRIVHQKILPKLRGDDRRAGALQRLVDRIALALREAGGDPDASRSLRTLARMRESVERYGTFQFWG
jgi:DNA polymerase III delta prime subunit